MGRINYSEDEAFAGQFDLWQANCERSLAGKAGQKSLQELETALLSLPSKRIIAHELENGSDVCAIGALARLKRITPKADPDDEMVEIGEECGMPRLTAWKVVEMNDMQLDRKWDGSNYRDISPEERYTEMLKWVQGKLKK